jgi:hypothetical protein
MSDPHDDDGSQASDCPAPSLNPHLRNGFETFHDEHYPLWFGYAYLQTGTRSAARSVCHDLSRCLAPSWPVIAENARVHHAWRLLKEILAVRLINRTESVFAETAAFHTALEDNPPVDEQLALMERALSLYWGMSRLSERQRDLLVLRYTLGQGQSAIAALFAEEESGIGAQLQAAEARLAALLGTSPKD